MHFVQINKNTWKCIADGPRDPITGKRRQITRRGKTKTEAKRRVEETIEELTYNYEYNATIKFNEFCEVFMKQYRLRGNKETTNIYREHCLEVVGRYIGNVKMKDITPVMLQNVMNSEFEKKTAHNTLRGIDNTIKQLFKYAVDAKVLRDSPASVLFVPKEKLKIFDDITQDIKQLYLEKHELKQLLDKADEHRNVLFRTAVYLIAFTGMRPGEAFALKIADIDFKNKRIHITKTIEAPKEKKTTGNLTPPKTKKSIRVIDIDDIVIEKIQYLLEYKRLKDWIITDFVFSAKGGYVPNIKSLNKFVKRLGESLEIDKQCRTYILRHTHISLLAEADVDLKYIMDRVGHAHSNTTTKIYLHVTEGMRQNAVNLMHKKFTELLTMPQK